MALFNQKLTHSLWNIRIDLLGPLNEVHTHTLYQSLIIFTRVVSLHTLQFNLRPLGLVLIHTLSIPNHIHSKMIQGVHVSPSTKFVHSKHFMRESHGPRIKNSFTLIDSMDTHTPYQSLTEGYSDWFKRSHGPQSIWSLLDWFSPYQSLNMETFFHFTLFIQPGSSSNRVTHSHTYTHPINSYPIYSKHFKWESHSPLQSKTHSFTLIDSEDSHTHPINP